MIREYIIKVDESKPDIMSGLPLTEPAKELVRCKYCERYYANGGNCEQVLADWFCSDGKRREENG